MYHANFCVTAMFRDLCLLQDALMLRQLLILVVVSMFLYEEGQFAVWNQLLTDNRESINTISEAVS